MLWILLLRFLLRLIFGVALAMSATSPREVTSGFFRVHMWVLLGLNTFSALVSTSVNVPHAGTALSVIILGAVASYLGSVCWLYQCPKAGKTALGLVAATSLAAGMLIAPWPEGLAVATAVMVVLDFVSSGLLMGATMSAMFLGHWYLNTPTMRLGPLRRLLSLMLIGVVARAGICAVGLAVTVVSAGWPEGLAMAALVLRWSTGLIGIVMLTVMVWKTLEIPNTQSATGILYVAVIFVFLGELSSQLLSVDSFYLV